MARGRLINKTLGSSRRFHSLVNTVPHLYEFAQTLYMLLVANTDDFGRYRGDAFTVKHAVFPTSPRTQDEFDVVLDALHAVGLAVRYEIDGEVYLQITKFDENQPGLLSKRTSSKYPEMDEEQKNRKFGPNLTQPNLTKENLTQPNPPPAGEHGERSASAQLRRASEQPVTVPCSTNPETPQSGSPPLPPASAQRGERASAQLALESRFDLFWETYPRKVGKDAARQVFMKLAPDNDLLDAMLSAIREQRASAQWLKEGGQYIPHPRTWLRQGRWKDEPYQGPTLSPRTIATATAVREFLKS